MRLFHSNFLSLLVGTLFVWTGPAAAAELDTLVQTIQAVGAEGKGNREAARAWQDLIQADASALPAILAALDQANPLAANYLRSGAETIADRQLQKKQKLPASELEKFVLDTKHSPRARHLAYELLVKVDPQAPDRLIPGMLSDPSVEFRRDAVKRLLAEAAPLEAAEKHEEAKAIYLKALQGARDADQVDTIVKALDKLGHQVSLPDHFGFVIDWKLIGPFDNTGDKGFNTAYPPETEIDLNAKLPGQKGEVAWTTYTTDDKYGIVDLAKAQGPHKGAATYAFSEFVSDRDRTVDLRLGTPNSWKVWVNGQLIFARNEYHRGMQLDQYRVQAPLKAGKNTILLKICQNEQTQDWAQRWQFQFRVCDGTGTAVLSQNRPGRTDQAALLNPPAK